MDRDARRNQELNQQLNRIIGGGVAEVGRYPYLASLTKERAHTCGGTLIADDMVLSAAHCGGHFNGIDVGRQNVKDKSEVFERFNIEKSFIHPGYTDATGSFDNDFMLVKLYGWSMDSILANINSDPSVPTSEEELYVTGWGVVNTETKEVAGELEEVSVNYMSNVECKAKKGWVEGYTQKYTLENQITTNMMCALDEGEDACQGDSGGPLIQKKGSAALDRQVGVVSWGLGKSLASASTSTLWATPWCVLIVTAYTITYSCYVFQLPGCADPVFPGMYARVSSQYQWIQQNVCAWAESPPAYFGCPPRLKIGDKPKRPVTVDLMLDRFPRETGWLIRNEVGTTDAYMAIGEYSGEGNKHVVRTVLLKEDTNYEFIMLDAYGDGLKFDGGYYKLWIGDTPYMGIQVASGNTFGENKIHQFYLPKGIVTNSPVASQPTTSISSSPSPTQAPESGPEDPHLTIGFRFDDSAEETGWAITSVETQELLMSKSFGTYSGKDNKIVFEKVSLPTYPNEDNQQYIFAILDAGRDGLCCEKGQGFFQVFYGDMADNKVMFRGGDFKYLQQFIFDLNGGIITSPPVAQRIDRSNNGGIDNEDDVNQDDVYASNSAQLSSFHQIFNVLIIPVVIVVLIV